MEIDVFTLFPEAFDWFASQRHVANALAAGHELHRVNYRDHTPLSGRQVDDTPFGGGAGMVLRVDVVDAALRARYGIDPVELPSRRRVIALDPGGRLLDDALVDELAAEPALTLMSGRYEGFDERVVEHFASDRVSIGRYVLAGGELAAMVRRAALRPPRAHRRVAPGAEPLPRCRQRGAYRTANTPQLSRPLP
jgi:tRNA (guanine37-N1)-methyltransferase